MNNTLNDRFARISALTPVRRREPLSHAPQQDDAERIAVLGAEVGRNRYGEYLVARQWYATPEMCPPDQRALRLLLPAVTVRPRQHAFTCAADLACRPADRLDGDARNARALRRAKTCAEQAKNEAVAHALDAAADPAKWLFLDIETTGLAGGTGTYAFLVGLAWWDSGGMTVEQLFMRDHDEEHSVLLEIAQRVRERPVLVTFNGKSFDWPLLETRFRMTRAIDVPPYAAHLDMLHPARNLWRLKVGSAKLAELETRILGAEWLGWSRSEDIDSSRIPEIYHQYMRGGPAEPLAGVFRHNRWDLRGLAALTGRIFRALATPETIEPGAEGALELYGVSRLLCRRSERSQARALYERALDAGLPQAIDRNARHELARLARRDGDFSRAAELWQELACESGPSFEACEQLAIHYERREGSPREAVRVSRFALMELRRAQRLGLMPHHRVMHFVIRFEQRLARLERNAAGEFGRYRGGGEVANRSNPKCVRPSTKTRAPESGAERKI